ncbi:hypothetical protein TNCV_966561 [Trichonephila clavipes]|nr:hypothetical protein TNCV_966561 [Trichonephila clavipes]
MGMTRGHRAWGCRPHLVSENQDNSSHWEDDEPDQGANECGDLEHRGSSCTLERLVHARWHISTFFDCNAQPPSCYIFQEVDWTLQACCSASKLNGPQSVGFLLLGSPEIFYVLEGGGYR